MTSKLQRYAADPAAFQADLIIPSAHGRARFGDVMADFQRARFASINPALVAIANDQKPQVGRHWWEATKGASKDSDLAVCILWLLAFSRRTLLCQIGAADRDQAAEMRKAAKDILALNPWLAKRVEVQTWQMVCKATDAVCEIVAADVSGSHGARPDVLVINELSHVTKREFAENLRDNADKVPQGLVVIATNAGFTGTWQYQWREISRTSPRHCFHLVDYPSPWLSQEDIAEAERRNTQERYRRLWHGVWGSGAGDAIDKMDLVAAVVDSLTPMSGSQRGFGFVAGLDLGVKKDRSAFVVLGRDSRSQRLRLANVQQWKPTRDKPVDLDSVEKAILQAKRDFGNLTVGYDPWQAALMAQRLTRQGVRMREVPFVGQNLNKMATEMMDVFRSRRIDLFPHEQLIADIRRLTIVEKSFGYKLESVSDADGHADTATALAIALMLKSLARGTGSWGGTDPANVGAAGRWYTHKKQMEKMEHGLMPRYT